MAGSRKDKQTRPGSEALARLGELQRLRDDMLEQLKVRVKSGWGGR